MPSREKGTYTIQAADNALALLEALGEQPQEVSLAELGRQLGLTKSHIFRLMATLEGRGYVEPVKQSGKYRLALTAFEVSRKLLLRNDLLQMARPVMERLAKDCRENVYLIIPRRERLLFLDMADAGQRVTIMPLVGKHFPIEGTAVGRVIQAFGGPREAGSSATLPEQEHEQIRIARQLGVASDCGGLGEGIASLAVPLYSQGCELRGCLALVGPDFRLTRQKISSELLPRLKEAGQGISSMLDCMNTGQTRQQH